MMDIVERLRDYSYDGDGWQLQQKAADEIERLRTENAELRADAERYRWLRANERSRAYKAIQFLGHYSLEELDAAIDAARKEQK